MKDRGSLHHVTSRFTEADCIPSAKIRQEQQAKRAAEAGATSANNEEQPMRDGSVPQRKAFGSLRDSVIGSVRGKKKPAVKDEQPIDKSTLPAQEPGFEAAHARQDEAGVKGKGKESEKAGRGFKGLFWRKR
jgi:hypothetical protein